MADQRISDLTAASSGIATDQVEVNQGGTSLRVTAQQLVDSGHGAWVTPTFNAGDFTGNGSMTWTLASGDVDTLAYTIQGKKMTVSFVLNTTTVGGTLNTNLQILIPASKTAAKSMVNPVYVFDNLVATTAYAQVNTAGTTISIIKFGAGNWNASTNQTYVLGQITFEIQ